MKYHEETRERIIEGPDGSVSAQTTRTIRAIHGNEEPDFIKLYTRMWCDFNCIPEKWRGLFMALVCRMSYANLNDSGGGQTVCTIGSIGASIVTECGWKNKDTLYRGLQALCECNAIKKINRGEYQINPNYAGKGPWRYNAKEERGGVENLIAKFSFADKTVDTQIVWVSSDEDEIGAEDSVIATKSIIRQVPKAV